MGVLGEKNEIGLMEEFKVLPKSYFALKQELFAFSRMIKEEKAQEYLFRGVMRRLSILERSTANILKIFPVDRNEKLKNIELWDVDINLQAFILNVYGVLDNLAWVYIYERKQDQLVDKMNVGMFKKETQKLFTPEFNEYLKTMEKWYWEYLVNFRDALSHRIPLYVPPMYLNPAEAERFKVIGIERNAAIKNRDFDLADQLFREEEALGVPSPHFCHSFEEKMTPQIFHQHLISDFKTLEQVIEMYKVMFGPI